MASVTARMRRGVFVTAIIAAGVGTLACIDRAPFACESDEQCEGAGQEGICASPGYCAEPDDSCQSQWAYGRFASPELVGRCTPVEGGSSSSGSDSDSRSSSSGMPVPLEECDGIDNDGDGLVDEWSPINEECEDCELFQARGYAYWRCGNEDWVAWQARCEDMGANLASVRDAEENLLMTVRTVEGASWLGLNDIGNEGNFTWVDGEPLGYTNWNGGGEPSNSPESNCVGINVEGLWFVFDCLNSRPGICKAPHPDE